MVEQLRKLLTVTEMPNVDIRLFPFGTHWHPGLIGLFSMIAPKHALPVVHLEALNSGLFLHEDEEVGPYQIAIESLRDVALSSVHSAELISKHLKRWEQIE